MKNLVRKNRRKLFLSALVGIMLAATLTYLAIRHNSNVPVTSEAPKPASGTTSQGVPHTTPPSSRNTPIGSGGVIDQKGQTPSQTPPPSQWVSSNSGNIILQQPTSGSTLHSGDTISGLAKVNVVQFILKDNSVGLISQGTLSVVNGRFSGIVTFKAHSGTGRLEVYYPNPSTGAEEDIIDINVQFAF